MRPPPRAACATRDTEVPTHPTLHGNPHEREGGRGREKEGGGGEREGTGGEGRGEEGKGREKREKKKGREGREPAPDDLNRGRSGEILGNPRPRFFMNPVKSLRASPADSRWSACFT